jgi:ATP-dependent Zn protease
MMLLLLLLFLMMMMMMMIQEEQEQRGRGSHLTLHRNRQEKINSHMPTFHECNKEYYQNYTIIQ